ncbi:uncharacterized protein LOC109420056 [Aedes albopictus]|uniref:Secreted protein n=1 Tax=Aedes albopictus TaxID=7160 RepID=A0ABM1ZRN9_AEDAL|nr:uncharacterized protein LOC109420056 [Aedes albopictus]
MKSIVTVFLVLSILVAAIICVPVPAKSSREVVCNAKGCTFPAKDYGPTVTPYTPTLKPRVRTIVVPPLWANTTWSKMMTTTLAPQQDRSSARSGEDTYDDREEDNAV